MLKILLFLLGSGCSSGILDAGELVVSKQFDEVMLESDYGDPNGRNVMEILKDHALVETGFGGGYVTAIQVGNKKWGQGGNDHWFYYVNGVLSSVGALRYEPNGHDHVWWDLHPWDGERFVSSVIGAWPEPFVHGHHGKTAPTRILFAEAFREEANRLKVALEAYGVGEVEVGLISATNTLDTKTYLLICVGTWPDLKKHEALAALLEPEGNRVGLFVTGHEGALRLLDWAGKKTERYSPAGTILALKSAFQEMNPIWVLSGTDDSSVKQAVSRLVNDPQSIRGHAGVLLSGEDVIDVPAFS